MKAEDSDKLLKAIVKDVNLKIKSKYGEHIPREQVPKGEQIIPVVWVLKHKRYINRN